MNLDSIYGKNFLVGKRIPDHPQITEVEACRLISDSAEVQAPASPSVDLIIIAFNHRHRRFAAHPCARELRKVMQAGHIPVALVDGNDVANVETLRTFHEEGITVFAREARCW